MVVSRPHSGFSQPLLIIQLSKVQHRVARRRDRSHRIFETCRRVSGGCLSHMFMDKGILSSSGTPLSTPGLINVASGSLCYEKNLV